MRSEQDIEAERLMNFRYDRNYIGIYRFFIILGSVFIIIGLFSEIRYFTTAQSVQAQVVSKVKMGETIKCGIVYEINNESYSNSTDVAANKYNDSNLINIKIRKGNPQEIVYQEHLLNAMLVLVGGVFFGYGVKKYQIEKRIDTSEEYKGL